MADRFVESQAVKLEVETGDSTFSTHTNKKVYYIPPTTEGLAGVIESVLNVAGTAVPGETGNSVNQGASITLIAGVYAFWSESDDGSGGHCVSPASEMIVEKRGTVRR